jgi:hypothetical protein
MHKQPEPVKGECNALYFYGEDYGSVMPDNVWWYRCYLEPNHTDTQDTHLARIPGSLLLLAWKDKEN